MHQPKFHYLGNKAGVDNATSIQQKVQQITQGSAYYAQQEKKRQLYLQKIANMNSQLAHYRANPDTVSLAKQQLHHRLAQLHYDQSRCWAHFDMDMFYIACELLDKPELADQPCAVGGLSMLSTANYVARKFGIRSAMPGFVAIKLCPQLKILPHNFEKYKNVSNVEIISS